MESTTQVLSFREIVLLFLAHSQNELKNSRELAFGFSTPPLSSIHKYLLVKLF